MSNTDFTVSYQKPFPWFSCMISLLLFLTCTKTAMKDSLFFVGLFLLFNIPPYLNVLITFSQTERMNIIEQPFLQHLT